MIYKYVNGDCMYVYFTIFDYVTRKIVFEGIYKQLEFLNEYNVEILYKLVKRSFFPLKFESSPFLQHLAILKSIISKNRIIFENLDEFELEYEKERDEESEYVTIEPKKIEKKPSLP